MKINNIYTFKQDDTCFEPQSKLPSETMPDMALSLNDILTRFTRGQAPDVQHEGTYSDNELLDDATIPVPEGVDPLTELDYSRARVLYLEKTYKDELAQAEKEKLEAEKSTVVDETKTDDQS